MKIEKRFSGLGGKPSPKLSIELCSFFGIIFIATTVADLAQSGRATES